MVIGVENNDEYPSSRTVTGGWGATYGAAVDYQDTSIAVDAGTPQPFRRVTLVNNSSTSRANGSDYEIYVSNDNFTYTRHSDWRFGSEVISSKLRHHFDLGGVVARYVKIHSRYSDSSYTFVLDNISTDVTAQFGNSGFPVAAQNNDTSPLTTAITGAWGATYGAAVDYLRTSIGIYVYTPQAIRWVTLRSSTSSTRSTGEDYGVYVSFDNANYTEVTDWHFWQDIVDGDVLHHFDLGEVLATYVKINSKFTDTAYTFVIDNLSQDVDIRLGQGDDLPSGFPGHVGVGNQQRSLRAFEVPQHAFVAAGGDSWVWRTPVDIENTNAYDLVDRAVYLSKTELDTNALISAGKLAADWRDLRFATSAGRELPLLSDGDGVFVRIPEVPSSSTVTIYAYHGNPAARHRAFDASALQVEKGHRTLKLFDLGTPWGAEATLVRLPNGTLMAAAGSSTNNPMKARYSTDGGRTWSALENILPSTMTDHFDLPGGFLYDSATGDLHLIYTANGYLSTDADWMDPNDVSSHIHHVMTTGWTLDGKPIFGTPVQLPLTTVGTNQAVAYALTITQSDQVEFRG